MSSERTRLILNGWGESGNGPVTVITPPQGSEYHPGKPGIEPLTFSEDDEAEFRAVSAAYLERVPRPVFKEEGPVTHIGEDEEPDTFDDVRAIIAEDVTNGSE